MATIFLILAIVLFVISLFLSLGAEIFGWRAEPFMIGGLLSATLSRVSWPPLRRDPPA